MTITIDDAFGLALIAKRPDWNADLIPTLSRHVQSIARVLCGEKTDKKEIQSAANALARWAHPWTKVSKAKYNNEIFRS